MMTKCQAQHRVSIWRSPQPWKAVAHLRGRRGLWWSGQGVRCL